MRILFACLPFFIFRQLSTLIRITDSGCGRLLHILNLLKSIICLVPENDIKSACECVLELTAFNNSLVRTFPVLQSTILHGQF